MKVSARLMTRLDGGRSASTPSLAMVAGSGVGGGDVAGNGDGGLAMRSRTSSPASLRAATSGSASASVPGSSSGAGIAVRWATTSSNIVRDALEAQDGWVRVELPRETGALGGSGALSSSDEGWDVLWGDCNTVRDVMSGRRLATGARINHFRNHYELTRKDLMTKNLKAKRRMAMKAGNAVAAAYYDILPASYALPQDYALFLEEFRRSRGATWIMKPIARSQGRGIFLFNKLSQVSSWRKNAPGVGAMASSGGGSSSGVATPAAAAAASAGGDAYVVQQYVTNPYLIGGKKFDLRLYVAVLSYSPLVVYVYRSGFARFSSVRFSADASELSNSLMHLTNVAVQKKSASYAAESGAKWRLANLKRYLLTRHSASTIDAAFARIQELIVASLRGVEEVIASDKAAFELYGYDVLLDDELRPWLLEVNASPSMSAENQEDYNLKFGLISDTLALLNLDGLLPTRYPLQVGGFDLVYWNGPPARPDPPLLTSFLGARNDRETQLPELLGPSYVVPMPESKF
ncbi:tubulin tyrosine ligase [Thecamonas trahens ATCC 50062]|uniref:Tubulin--tyrosine ligase-like protein 9 n=1 Tax=Thecamonas trahens ATCC 50062 TaxID=461836 RepID=A0A0L0DQ84_THETB|nr:tubulin tyrosine ligase [Thecamonas trahens ATCC 50062]KNC54186.1 tubulin tyrosine ligase [Thecamonas trahens ATCC 50062]|eukprot:XP_013754002.1 tubulin tyrosine ligase [Thecamonas trahens ATCC 50062]